MISQRPKLIRNSIILVIGISVVILFFSFEMWNTCGIKHIAIISDVEKYEETLDPEFCMSLVERIFEYNEFCDGTIEILDCG